MEFAQLWCDCSCLNFQVALEIEMESSLLTLETVGDKKFWEAENSTTGGPTPSAEEDGELLRKWTLWW